jgi:small subunit ribosomal protein S18
MAKNEIKYLTAIKADKRPKKYCRFKKMGIKYIDYKDVDFLKKFLNEQGKVLPRRLTGNSLKYQRKVSDAIKKARQMALLPYVTDLMK